MRGIRCGGDVFQQEGRAVIDDVRVVSVPVSDPERARHFYVDTLGFERREAMSWGEGMRWLEAAPRGPPPRSRW
jgi:hypothetical protein